MIEVSSDNLADGLASAIAEIELGQGEVLLGIDGRRSLAVLDIERYRALVESELVAAWLQTKADVAAGRFLVESAAEHMARLRNELAGDESS